MVRRIALIMVLAATLLATAGCAGFWEAQGDASRASAEARLRQAEAARENARAAIIDAEARGTMAESQADALRSSIDAVVDLADDGEYVAVFAGLAFGVLAFAGWAIWATHRRSAAAAVPPPAVVEAPRQWVTLETDMGPVRMIREPMESPEQFTVRVALMAAQLGEQQARLVAAPMNGRNGGR